MIYHYHLTLSDTSVNQIKQFAKQIKGKVTTIDLQDKNGGHYLSDRMVTKYGTNYNQMLDEIRSMDNPKIIRKKIERVLLDGFPDVYPDGVIMLEAHIKVSKDFVYSGSVFKRSKNPVQDTVFLNARIHNQKELDNFKIEIQTIPIIKSQYEEVLYDSNIKHDDKW